MVNYYSAIFLQSLENSYLTLALQDCKYNFSTYQHNFSTLTVHRLPKFTSCRTTSVAITVRAYWVSQPNQLLRVLNIFSNTSIFTGLLIQQISLDFKIHFLEVSCFSRYLTVEAGFSPYNQTVDIDVQNVSTDCINVDEID